MIWICRPIKVLELVQPEDVEPAHREDLGFSPLELGVLAHARPEFAKREKETSHHLA